QALAGKAEQRVGTRVFGELVATGARSLEGLGAGVEREEEGCGLVGALGIAIDAAHFVLQRRISERAVELGAELLDLRQPLNRRLLAELAAGGFEGEQHTGRVDPRAIGGRGILLRSADALLGRLRLALELGQLAVDTGQLPLDLGNPRV